jgi:hypothetical protein
VKTAYKWHRWIGWILAPVLLVSASSGIALLWLQPLPSNEDTPPAAAALAKALDTGLAEIGARYPGYRVETVDLPEAVRRPIRAHIRLSGNADAAVVEIDASSGIAGPPIFDVSDAKTLLFHLHDHLLLAEGGRWVLRAIALVALVLIGMGLRIWWRVRKLPTRSQLRRWHRAIGALAMLPLVIVFATGFVLSWPEFARYALSGWTAVAPAAPTLAGGNTAAPASWGDMLVTASSALPHARPTRIYSARSGVVRVRLHAGEWNRFGLNDVYVRADVASVLRVVRSSEQPIAVRYIDFVYPIHSAWLPGEPSAAWRLVMRALWTIVGVSLAAMALSGAAQRLVRQ